MTPPPPPENAIYPNETGNEVRHGLGKVYQNSLYVAGMGKDF